MSFVMRLLLGILICASSATFAKNAKVEHDYIRIPLSEVTPNFVSKYGFIRDHVIDDQYAFGYVTKQDFKRIPSVVLKNLTLVDAMKWAHNDMDPKTLQVRPAHATTFGTPEPYHTYETLTSELKTLGTQFQSIVTVASAGKTVEGRDLWYLRVTSQKLADELKPKLLYISSMHGDEVVGKEMLVYLTRDLLNGYGKDARVTALVDHSIVYLMPSMNPDGTVHQQRFNANGVDLNRDFPGLDEEAFSGGRAVETQAIMNLHKANNFQIAINFHTGALCFNTPWDSKPNGSSDLFGDDELMQAMGNEYATLNANMHKVNGDNFVNGVTYGYEWYQVLGGMQDWASFFREASHATVELSDVKWPSASTLAGFWSDNRESLLTYLERGTDGVHVKVTDAQGALLDVGVDLSTTKRTLHYHGYVNRPAITGSQTVTLSSPGYVTQTLNTTSSRFNGEFQNVVLVKN